MQEVQCLVSCCLLVEDQSLTVGVLVANLDGVFISSHLVAICQELWDAHDVVPELRDKENLLQGELYSFFGLSDVLPN